MNRSVFIKAGFLLITLVGSLQLNAQKYGHLNFGNFLEKFPAVEESTTKLKTLNDSLATVNEKMSKEFEAFYTQAEKDNAEGKLTRIQLEETQKQLQTKQAELQGFQESAEKMIQDRRASLLKPILDRVQNAIKEVAKENGYAMIFDTSAGTTLFAQESDDITALVKKKLGMQ